MKDPFRSVDVIAQIKAPLLILHGEADRDGAVPVRRGAVCGRGRAEAVRAPARRSGTATCSSAAASPRSQAFLACDRGGAFRADAGSPAAPAAMTLTLRTALPSDRDAVIDLIFALNLHEADLTGDRRRDRSGAAAYHDELLQRLSRRNGRIVLAAADGRVVGAMGFCIDEDAAYVTPTCAGTGR